jgi:nucleotide-binding universal stress UspA family protein
MGRTVLLAVALQHWERYSAHALAARDVAATLARGTANTLYVLSTYDYAQPSPFEAPMGSAARGGESLRRQTDDLMHRKVEDYAAPLQHEDFNLGIILRVGRPRDVIVQVARNLKADLLVLGSHSKRSMIEIALGSTARQVSRQAPCPVVLVSPPP